MTPEDDFIRARRIGRIWLCVLVLFWVSTLFYLIVVKGIR